MSGVDPPDAFRRALAVTVQYPRGGGLILVYADRLGGARLDLVMLHELAHALGLQHNSGGYLMSADFSRAHYACIDRRTVEALAALRHLPLNELNWCTY